MTNSNASVVVMLIEDEPLVRMYAADVLKDDGGYRVIEAANADEALTLLRVRHDVRVLCTDIDMPGSMDGIALARVVAERWPRMSLVATSGRQRPNGDELPARALFLPKPYTPDALLDAVRTVIGDSRPIVLPVQDVPAVEPGAPVVSVAIKIDQRHTGAGLDGGIAQPLQEPDT